MKRVIWLLILILGLGAPLAPTAFADGGDKASFDSLTESQKRELIGLIDAGRAAYDRGDFDRALRYFMDAYSIFPHPDILYRIALTYERLGEDAEAVQYYRQFLKEVPDAEERGRIENTISVIERRMAAKASQIRVVTEPSGALVYINDVANGVAGYSPTELPVSPGKYRIIIEKDGFETIEEGIEVPPGQTVVLRYGLKKPVEPQPATSSNVQVKPLVLSAIGVGATVGAITFTMSYLEAEDQLASLEAQRQELSRRDGQAQIASAQSRSNLFQILAWTSAGVAVGSFLWAFLSWSDTTPSGTASLNGPTAAPEGFSLWLTPETVGLGLSGQF